LRGDDVVVIDDYSTGLRSRTSKFPASVQIIQGDIRDSAAIDDAAAGCDVILHQAAITSVVRSFREPRLTNDINASGTIEVMLSAARAGVRRVVYASSAAVYGVTPNVPTRESEPVDPRSPYAASKAAGEYYLKNLGSALGVETVALRYFNVFGPGQDPRAEYAAVIPRFVTAAIRGERLVIYGDGSQTRDFTHVDNVVAANLLAASAHDIDGLTANIGSGAHYSLNELLNSIGECLSVDLVPVYAPPRVGDPTESEADITTARQRLGYEVTVSFEQGLRSTVESYRAAGSLS
jgi:UDP-glucose 4-epimerase